MIKRNIYLMYLVTFLQGMVFYAPVATLYRQAQGVSVVQITLIESIFLVLCLALELPWGVLADRLGYKRTMVICNGLYFASKLIFWRADSFGDFFLERFLLAVVVSGLSGVDSSLLYLSCKGEDSQKIFGIYSSMGTAGLLTAAFVYANFVGESYQFAALLTCLSYGLAFLLTMGLREVKQPDSEKTDLSEQSFFCLFKQTMKNKRILLFLLGVALFSEVHQTVTVFLSQLQYVRCGLSNQAIGNIYILTTLVGLLSSASSFYTRKLGIRKGGYLLYAVAGAVCFWLAMTDNGIQSILAVLLLTLTSTLFEPLQMRLQNQMIVTDNRATALSINAMLIDVVGAVSNLLFGQATEHSLRLGLMLGGIFCLIGFWCFAGWNRQNSLSC